MRKLISCILLSALLLTLCSCSVRLVDKNATTSTTEQFPTDAEGNPLPPSDATISPEQAMAIAREALGITEEQMLSPFVHIGEYGDPPQSCYSVQFATLEYDYEFVISAKTGEILHRSDETPAPQEGGQT